MYASITSASMSIGESRFTRSTMLLQFFSRMSFQLAIGISLGIVLPVVLRHLEVFAPEVRSAEILQYRTSILSALGALLFGCVILRKTTALPGAEALMNVVPAFLIGYGVILAVLLAFRLDYSRYILGLSFVLTTAWFYLVVFLDLRVNTPSFGVIDGGNAGEINDTPGIRTMSITSLAEADSTAPLPLVVDFRADSLSDEWERYLAEQAIQGRVIYNAPHLVESLEGKVHLRHMTGSGIGQVARDSIYGPAKRHVDAITALVALILLSPVLLLTASLIRLDSPGPALFRQPRVGYRGQTFTVFKFRSMRLQSATERDARSSDMTRTDDDRITRIGRVIRKLRIDELPQLINVVRGEMSWIGPRPETDRLSAWYEQEIPFYRIRHSVRPGITGWAQVRQGHVVSVEDVREKLEYDLFYVKHFSFWFDVAVAVHTVRVILTGRGAR